MKLKESSVKWMMNFFPPLFFNRIKVTFVSKNFRELRVKVKNSLMNRNLQRTIFGGTIFSAADPYYAIMYWQVFAHDGIKTEAWLKEANIEYLKPAATDIELIFTLTEEDVSTAKNELKGHGKFSRWHQVEAKNTSGEVVAIIKTLVYLRSAKGEDKMVI